MPRQLDQLPPDATSLARRVQELERQMREIRGTRRAAYTGVSAGGIKVFRPGSDVPAAVMSSDLGDGEAGFQTNSTDGSRYARLESGELTFGTPEVTQFLRTGITATPDGGTLDIQSGLITGGSQAHIILASGDSPLAPGNGAPMISLEWDGAGSEDMVVDIGGILEPRSMAWGSVSLTPTTANTPISTTVNGLNVRGNTFLAYATAVTSRPGSTTTPDGVTGVSTTGVSSTGLTVWMTRQSLTATTVNWLVIGL